MMLFLTCGEAYDVPDEYERVEYDRLPPPEERKDDPPEREPEDRASLTRGKPESSAPPMITGSAFFLSESIDFVNAFVKALLSLMRTLERVVLN